MTLTKEELFEFAKKVYEEASYSYLDLRDSTCDALVEDFFEKKTSSVLITASVITTSSNLVWTGL